MGEIAWVTDSTSILDDETANHPDLYQVPLPVILDGKEYLDGVDLTEVELFAKLKDLCEVPKTSQPSVGAFKSLYEKLAENYEEVIAVLVSGKLSGTIDSSHQASKLLNQRVTIIDSKILSYPQTALIKRGIELARRGQSSSEIKAKLEEMRDLCETYVLVGSLEQLHRSGRMSNIKYLLGSVLNIKPIISFKDGSLVVKDIARSEQKAKAKIFGYFRSSWQIHKFKEAWLLYGLKPDVAHKWKEELEKEYKEVAFSCYPLGAVIGVHAGENTIGISWFNH